MRIETDLRSGGPAYGLVHRRGGSAEVGLLIDPGRRTVSLSVRGPGGAGARSVSASLPTGFDPARWHAASLDISGGRVHAELSHARQGDPLAVLTLKTGWPVTAGKGGAYATGAGVGVDNLSFVRAATPVTRLAPTPVPNRLDRTAGDEFNGTGLRPGWTWVRQDQAATVTGGNLRWPTEDADLVGPSGNAGVLLRDVGDGNWSAVTKLSIDLGTDTVRNYQQGGLIVYVNDDLFTRLSHVAIWNTRQTEFGKEMPAGQTSYGGTIIGPPATTTWLRITHHRDPANGEHELRGWSSTDGATWIKGGVWSLPADARIRVGLISHGGAGATSTFDWFRVYRG